MRIRIDNLKLGLDDEEALLLEKISRLLNEEVKAFDIIKKSLDARRKEAPFFLYQVVVETSLSLKRIKKLEKKGVRPYEEEKEVISFGEVALKHQPIIIGFGPAGLFCAYELAKYGYTPLVFEQGECVEARVKSVEAFWQTGRLNPLSNVQFGEGGAGTFSDGKLTSRSKSPLGRLVLETFYKHGAPKEIMYDKKPHIGTDLLRPVIASMRKTILANGGEVYFNREVKSLIIDKDLAIGIELSSGEAYYSDCIILATGHSARKLFYALNESGVALSNKPFAVGFRIEHKQAFINKHQYRDYATHKKLGAADYQLASHDNTKNRGVYTFCMCPGGEVVLASSEENRTVVNGMSYYSRAMENANSAVLISVDERDYGEGALAGLKFQECLEEMTFKLTGKGNVAPVQRVGDFLKKQKSTFLGGVIPSVRQYELSDLSKLLSSDLYESFSKGLIALDKKFSDFAMDDSILTGMETRSSSPVKIERDEHFESVSHKNLYPIGEGAGYAGGIVSSAIDGIKAARVIMKRYKKMAD